MTQDARLFEAIKISLIGAETGPDRFTKDGNVQMPPVARWRNNLTALSARENLFFIAFERVVAVYEPEFPFQTLRRTPALFIKPELCNPTALGFINQHRDESPHAINHIIVGELGSREILLFATDSGNVEAYYTSSIAEAVRKVAEQRREAPSHNAQFPPSADTSLRPFFCDWVKRSAWGLAIHKDARMIAVSANTPNENQPSDSADASAVIVVFAFSLTSHEASDGSEPVGEPMDGDNASVWLDWVPNGRQAGPPRDRNYKVVLAGLHGHRYNIPNISFVNSTEDHEGTWLMSTDTAGSMKLWQIWRGECYRTWPFGHVGRTVRLVNHEYPGWNVAALDLGCFRPCRNFEEFIGAPRAPPYHDYHGRGFSYSLTEIVRRRIPNTSELHPEHPDATSDRESSDGDDLRSSFDISDDEQHHSNDTDMVDHGSQTDDAQLHQPATTDENEDLEMQGAEIVHEPFEFGNEVDNGESSGISEDEDPNHGYSDSDEDDSEALSTNEPLITPPSRMNWLQRQRLVGRGGSLPLNRDHVPSFAILHCTDSHVRMLAGPKEAHPHAFCAHILKQLLPEYVYTHNRGLEFLHMDRLNMIHVIRELGIVLIASQAGRVALCSLGRTRDGIVGFRVDWIIPTKRQERQGMRPSFCVLIGIAVSPVQGRHADQDTSTDDDEDSSWCKDGPVDGVETTFDPDVVVLSPRPSKERSNLFIKPESKKRAHAELEPATGPDTEKHSWKKPPDIPPWVTTENSRRYRVMLTYSDMTVLTYEIWRGVERGDLAKDVIHI